MIALDASQRLQLVEYATLYRLDYDDAYQYTVAELYDLVIVSYDKDFDQPPRGRREPGDLLQQASAT